MIQLCRKGERIQARSRKFVILSQGWTRETALSMTTGLWNKERPFAGPLQREAPFRANGHEKALQGTWHENSNIETKIRFFLFTLHRVSSGSSSSLHHSASLLKRSELIPVSFTNNSFTTWKSK
jgi:hypothetical protein